MQMRGRDSGCVIYLFWRGPSVRAGLALSARLRMTHAFYRSYLGYSAQLAAGGSAFAGGAFAAVAGAGFFFAAASASFASTSAASTGCIS
jgi:hypothetical protein